MSPVARFPQYSVPVAAFAVIGLTMFQQTLQMHARKMARDFFVSLLGRP